MTYNIKLNVFEGPFDLLVYLIEKAQMDIYDIQISEITQQYIDYMEMMKKFNLEVAAEFLVLAATLIEIKSRMLLPNKEAALNENIEEIDPRTELVQKILEYKKFKNAAEELKEREEIASHIYFKVKEDIGYQNGNSEYIDLDLDQFIQAFNLFLKKKKKIFDIQKKYLE
ncbi:MAG: segregation/condensation protein A, partial [Clostridiales bacterium]|nr:segregation/condensation protein A [Clostridiales bacterium]